MTNPDHFRGRAKAYRQLAAESEDETRQGDFLEIAGMFSAMADDLSALRAGSIVTILPSRPSTIVTLEWRSSRMPCAGT